MTLRVTFLIGGIALVAGCAEPPPPRSVQEFLDNPIVLEAALVRCSRNRSETRYEAECVNAREANKIVAAREEAERRAAFEAQSERKRQALRRAQEAAAEARRRAAEAEKQREEAAYLAQFGELPSADSGPAEEPASGNVPMAVLPEPRDEAASAVDESYSEPLFAPASDASNAPVAEAVPEPEPARNLDEIREELKRRNEE
jgi:multidrug efflux pump subunit AcrA (membrane-fusion protein)